MVQYTIFPTEWGYFGLAGTDEGVCRAVLPAPKRDRIKRVLLNDLPGSFEAVHPAGDLLGELRERVIAYFQGRQVDFGDDLPVALGGHGPFTQAVLSACRQIGYGRKTTYGALAERMGRPRAARAVGNALARNPIPLIIPCHRVICRDGGLGGFSALGGTRTKERMLLQERSLFHAASPGPDKAG